MDNTLDLNRLARSSRISALASLAGLLIVVISLGYSSFKLFDLRKDISLKRQEISSLRQESAALEGKVQSLEGTIHTLEGTITDLEQRISDTMVFDRHRYQVDWGISKSLASNQRNAQIISDIFEMKYRNIPWKLGGTSPETGFDSPSFAAYLLIRKHRIIDVDFSKRYRLRELIPPTESPKNGDLIFYDTGYTMFYFKDRSGHPFCIGMTPLGIVALEIEFGPKLLGYGRIDYR